MRIGGHVFFFFQAEDGIRELVRSRGLGDVYKRQVYPTVALINNAQREHLEFMHTVRAVALENGSVITPVGSQGVVVFPRDDEFAPLWQTLAGKRRQVSFALDTNCLLYTSPSPRDRTRSRMPSSA